MVASPGNPDTKPYGLHRLWIYPYLDSDGSVLSNVGHRMPIARKFMFTETEETDSLDGDDKTALAIQGKGASVDGSLEAGGLDLMTYSIITGAQLVESGLEPNLKRTVRKRASDQRPYFRIDGQVISNGGGDHIARVWRCRANGKVQADMQYGTWMTPVIDIKGTPLPFDDADWLYEIEFNQTKTTLGSTPTPPNPLPSVNNLTVGTITATTVDLSWTDVPIAEKYLLQQAPTGTGTWTNVTVPNGGEPTDPETTVAGLTTATGYDFRVAPVVNGVTGEYSSLVTATTL
ncbi:fibronectin type III domain-containing protein [Mycobacterium canetti]|uniref:fibronectin type III domain-containing protein n=1 Tax=Mycobacterium canetti TaxID=78331 RepID=UPI00034CBCEC|nr:fibronectin type III domain-containing protein [Mycobacterium canetti]